MAKVTIAKVEFQEGRTVVTLSNGDELDGLTEVRVEQMALAYVSPRGDTDARVNVIQVAARLTGD